MVWVVVLCFGQPGRLCGVGTITLKPAKHTALGHALRKENTLDKTYYILWACSSLCLKKTSNYFICSQRGKEGRSGRWDYVKGQLRRDTEQPVSAVPAQRTRYTLMVFWLWSAVQDWHGKNHIMAIPGTSCGLLRLVGVKLFLKSYYTKILASAFASVSYCTKGIVLEVYYKPSRFSNAEPFFSSVLRGLTSSFPKNLSWCLYFSYKMHRNSTHA